MIKKSSSYRSHFQLLTILFITVSLSVFQSSCSDYNEPLPPQIIIPDDASDGDFFGESIDVSNNQLIVGSSQSDRSAKNSGAVYIYNLQGDTTWVEQSVLSEYRPEMYYGTDVVIFGSRAIVGSRIGSDAFPGAVSSARILETSVDGTWEEVEMIPAPDRSLFETFGRTVALSEDMALVGAPSQYMEEIDMVSGIVYVFEKNEDNRWVETARLIPDEPLDEELFGESIAIFEHRVVIGAPGNSEMGERGGAVYIFEKQNGNWSQQRKIVSPSSEAQFGKSVDAEGELIVVGAPWASYEGAAYIYEYSGTDTWTLQERLRPENLSLTRTQNRRFGNSVSISGHSVLIGAPFQKNQDETTGAIYQYEFTNDSWELNRMISSEMNESSDFGSSVLLTNEFIITGAPRAFNNEEVETGALYIYKR